MVKETKKNKKSRSKKAKNKIRKSKLLSGFLLVFLFVFLLSFGFFLIESVSNQESVSSRVSNMTFSKMVKKIILPKKNLASLAKIRREKEKQNILEEARKNIEETRKTELTLEGLSPQALYSLELKKHSFPFGTAISGHFMLLGEKAFAKIYPERRESIKKTGKSYSQFKKLYWQVALKYFNGVTPENVFKWKSMEVNGKTYWKLADDFVYFLKKEDPVLLDNFRGHCVFWNRTEQLPASLSGRDKETIKKAILNERLKIIKRYPQIKEWDLVNEPLRREPLIVDGVDRMEVVFDPKEDVEFFSELFKKAKEINPEAQFYVNENRVLGGKATDDLVEFIIKLQELGAPVDGVGIEGHITKDYNFSDVITAKKNIDKLAKLGIAIKITEFDVTEDSLSKAGDDFSSRGKYLEDMLTLFYGTPQISGIYLWGFIDSMHWRGQEQAGLFDKNFKLNLVGESFFSKINEEWSTKVDATTDDEGKIIFRGFPGRYKITNKINGKILEKDLE